MKLDAAFLHALEQITPVRLDEPLSRHTTIGIGGPADAYAVAGSASELGAMVRLCRQSETPFFVLGSGSNIVVGDRGIRGLVVAVNATAHSEPRDLGDGRFLVRAEAGCSFAALARQLSLAGFSGLEWASGIPGSVGGAVVYNAGAYGGCLADVLQRIAVADQDGETVIEAAELGMVYRGSAFTRGLMDGRAVLWAEFVLWQGDVADLRHRVADFDARRLKAQPRGRNAGSFFKNPTEQPAWKLIETVGLRGYRIGDAQFSDKHCNFLINAGSARATDVAGLKRLAQERVRAQFGIELQNEVSLVGEGFSDD